MTIEEAVLLVIERSKLMRCLPRDSAREVWEQLGLGEESINFLAQEAIGIRASEGLRRPPFEETIAIQESRPVSVRYETVSREEAPVRYRIFYETWLESAEGEKKPIMEFTKENWSFYTSHNDAQIEGLLRHNRAANFCSHLLERHAAEKMENLPQEALNLAEVAWKAAREGSEVPDLEAQIV